MKKTLALSVLVAVFSCMTAYAQKFNPKVEVTNDYEGKVMEAQKADLKMAVPDSLLRFQYKLDYSVFDNPYNGSYDFQPYRIEMRPDPVPSTEHKFYLSFGAGYQLHPEGDLVYTPVFKKFPVRLSIYDRFRSFWGDLGNVYEDVPEAKAAFMEKDYMFDNRAGVSARYEWANMALDADVNYRLLSSRDSMAMHFYQGAEGQLKLSPLNPAKAGYFYGAKLYVKAGKDDMSYPEIFASHYFDRHKIGVNNMGFDASFGTVKGFSNGIVADVGMQAVINSGFLEATATRLWFAPHYLFNFERGYVSLGAKVSYLTGTDRTNETAPIYTHKSNVVYPDVKIKFFIVPDKLSIYADATGGDKIYDYATLLEKNPFLNPFEVVTGLDSSSERVNAKLGFEGDLGRKFHFDLSGGYISYLNECCDAICADRFYPYAYNVYLDYNTYHGDFSFLFKSARVDIDGRFTYRMNDIDIETVPCVVLPSDMEGDIRFTYNWQRRAYLGFSVFGETSRDWVVTEGPSRVNGTLPGYIDLGVHARYVINPRWTVWAKGGNLLNQHVQTYLMRPEKSPYGTLGISFNI